MFAHIKNYLTKTCAAVAEPLKKLFERQQLGAEDIATIKALLLQADVGVPTTDRMIKQLNVHARELTGAAGKDVLKKQLFEVLGNASFSLKPVVMVVGANGTGKTTSLAKLAYALQREGKRVLLVAADTFRAAATEQLVLWAQRCGCVCIGQPGHDPAALVYQACERYKREAYDIVLIDTAGRLQTQANLMNELGKMVRVAKKQVGDDAVCVLLTIDGMLGQNSWDQALLFNRCVTVDGVILTKMDGSGKGGVVLAIADQLHIPVAYVTTGETLEGLDKFDAQEYVRGLLGEG